VRVEAHVDHEPWSVRSPAIWVVLLLFLFRTLQGAAAALLTFVRLVCRRLRSASPVLAFLLFDSAIQSSPLSHALILQRLLLAVRQLVPLPRHRLGHRQVGEHEPLLFLLHLLPINPISHLHFIFL
jgi:hypothetical protein